MHTGSIMLTARAAVAITPPWLWSTPAKPTWALISTPGTYATAEALKFPGLGYIYWRIG